MNELLNDTFFITLFSNESEEYHKENIENNFINQFEKHIELNRKMEVALFQLITPKICNIPELTFSLIVQEYDYNEKILLEKTFRQIYITNEEELNDKFSNLCVTTDKEVKSLLKNYHELKRRFNINYKNFELPTIEFYNNMAFFTVSKIIYDAFDNHNIEIKDKIIRLYWKIDKILENKFEYKSILTDSPIDVSIHWEDFENSKSKFLSIIKHINVCSDIIDSSFVGNKKISLLRILSKSSLDVNNNSINFNPLIFIPVRKQIIESINICLIDENNKDILLDKGLTTVVLLFRPIEHI